MAGYAVNKETKSHCDPIIKLKSKDMKVKKFITDHITNILSEATTGKDFMGWAISSDTNYKAKHFTGVSRMNNQSTI